MLLLLQVAVHLHHKQTQNQKDMKTLSSIILKASVLTTLVAFLLINCNENEETDAIKPQAGTAVEMGASSPGTTYYARAYTIKSNRLSC